MAIDLLVTAPPWWVTVGLFAVDLALVIYLTMKGPDMPTLAKIAARVRRLAGPVAAFVRREPVLTATAIGAGLDAYTQARADGLDPTSIARLVGWAIAGVIVRAKVAPVAKLPGPLPPPQAPK